MKVILDIKFEPSDWGAVAAFAQNFSQWQKIGDIAKGAFQQMKDTFDEAGKKAFDGVSLKAKASVGTSDRDEVVEGSENSVDGKMEPPEDEK